jgi:putative CocE/NonD family hydrolase
MRGVSWGGFSALQAAALAPPALKAIMPMCASDMRYTDDAHYIGGAYALTGLKWATSMKMVLAAPPDPLLTGETWLEAWKTRLEAAPAIAARWLIHQTNDAYWRQGSVGLDWDAIRCAVYAVGGLVDPYGNLIPRLLAALKAPRKAIFGPWRHGYPAPAAPGPGLDWAWEEIRWWRHWLMGEATGIMDEPMLRAYMPTATATQVSPGAIPGRWVAEAAWPAAGAVGPRAYHLSGGILSPEKGPPQAMTIQAGAVVGLGNVEWVPFAPSELPREQSSDDDRSLVFDSAALAGDVEILGNGALRVKVAADEEIAHLAVRLCDVEPDGRSWLVAYGLLNLTHRDGHAAPETLAPGVAYQVEITLGFTAHRFAAGHRIRIALSQSLWPLVWPAPKPATLTLDLSDAVLLLPVREAPDVEATMPIAPAPPQSPNPLDWPTMEISESGDEVSVVETWPLSRNEMADIGLTVSSSGPNVAVSMTAADPLSCAWRAEQSTRLQRPGWDVAICAEVSVRCTAGSYLVEERTVATLNGEIVADMSVNEKIARRLA